MQEQIVHKVRNVIKFIKKNTLGTLQTLKTL